MPVAVRTLTAADWPLWRDLTLRALAADPDAFRPTLAESLGQPDEFWQEMVGPTAEHERFNLWVATADGEPVGRLFASIDEDFTTVYVGAMWVDAGQRGQGVGKDLMAAAIEWGRQLGVTRSELWVTDANAAATAFYAARGYEPTDDTQFLREGSDLVVRKMQLTL